DRNLTDRQRSACEFVLSFIERDSGNVEASKSHLQRSISLALMANDQEQACLAQMRLAALLDDHSGPEAASTLLSEVRARATKLGNPHISAGLHLVVGELDGKRGL